jgi:hypothetical protein
VIKETLHYLQAEDSHRDKRSRKFFFLKHTTVEKPHMTGQLYSKEPYYRNGH